MNSEDVDALVTAIGGVKRALAEIAEELRKINHSLTTNEEQPSE